MTMIQERAFDMIKRMPDEKLFYIVKLLEEMDGQMSEGNTGNQSIEQIAYADLQKYRKCSDVEINYKEELEKAREEKYAGTY